VEVQLDAVPTGSATLSPTVKLFSESNSRFLCEVSPELAAVFEGQFSGLPVAKIGGVVDAPRVTIQVGGETLIDAANDRLKEAWQRPLRW
jgi:phosphoribosylformylglycinamidine synthase